MRVFILDEVTVHPGRAGAFRDLYRSRYMAGARRRGMRLDGAWQNPPGVEYDELPTTLFYLWSVDDVAAWWDMRKSRTPEGADERYEKHAFWQEAQPMIAVRSRRFLSPLEGED